MRVYLSRLSLLVACILLLAGCSQMTPSPSASASQETAVVDDEAFCRNQGAPGSDAYAACLKNRDAARSQHEARMDRTHKRMVEDMVNRR